MQDIKKALETLVFKSRSYRRFHEKEKISGNTLKDFVNLARLSPSAANLQPLKYLISCDSEINNAIFPCLNWAGYLTGWQGPQEGERPSAYIVMLHDTSISQDPGCDHGIAAQTIMLAATAEDIEGCIIGSLDRERLRTSLGIGSELEILLVIALGKAKERVILELIKDGDVKYWRDKNSAHHVPKRPLDEILVQAQRPPQNQSSSF